MADNIEIKAIVRDWNGLCQRARSISDTPCETLIQEDVFFHVPQGRLKLRIFAPDRGELIAYERENCAGPKQSRYWIAPMADPAAMRQALQQALGIRGIVKKTRLLFRVAHTRIHLDEVENLGHYMELEVVLQPGQSREQGEKIARDLMARLQIAAGDLIAVAYLDLLEKRSPKQ